MGAVHVLAKAAEAEDAAIFRMTGVVSGHTLKHILAGAAAGLVLVMLARRRSAAKEAQ